METHLIYLSNRHFISIRVLYIIDSKAKFIHGSIFQNSTNYTFVQDVNRNLDSVKIILSTSIIIRTENCNFYEDIMTVVKFVIK